MLLAGCGSDGDKTKPTAQSQPAASSPKVNCQDPAQAKLCGPGSGLDPVGPPTTAPAAPMQLGQTATTTGDEGIGTLELTPTTIVYSTGPETGTVPQREIYVTITIKRQNNGTVPAEPTEARPDGWGYITPDGEDVNTAIYVIPSGFVGTARPIEPGTHQWGAATWSINQNQRGGTITYTDGAGATYRWSVPAQDTGPQIAEVKKGLR